MDLLSLILSLVRRNPYPIFSFMRRYRPVFQISKYKLWLVFGFDDVRRVLTEHATFSSDFGKLQGAEAMDNPQMRASLVSSDPPVHTKLRGLVTRAFTARAVANLEPRKLRGILSQGMIVAASLEGGNPVLASFLEDVPIGARLK